MPMCKMRIFFLIAPEFATRELGVDTAALLISLLLTAFSNRVSWDPQEWETSLLWSPTIPKGFSLCYTKTGRPKLWNDQVSPCRDSIVFFRQETPSLWIFPFSPVTVRLWRSAFTVKHKKALIHCCYGYRYSYFNKTAYSWEKHLFLVFLLAGSGCGYIWESLDSGSFYQTQGGPVPLEGRDEEGGADGAYRGRIWVRARTSFLQKAFKHLPSVGKLTVTPSLQAKSPAAITFLVDLLSFFVIILTAHDFILSSLLKKPPY